MNKEQKQNYKAFARGILLNKETGKTKTVVVDAGDTDVIVVLKAPPENEALTLYETAGNGAASQLAMASKFLVMMAHAPRQEGGEVLDIGENGQMKCLAAEKLFDDTDYEAILELPLGHPFASARNAALEFAGELANDMGNSNPEVADGGTSGSQNTSEESTSETSESGTKDE